MNGVLIKKDAYLYSLSNDKIKMYEGDIRMISWYNDIICTTQTKNIKCSAEPGVVHGNVVWLPERDDNRAITHFIQYGEAEVMSLKERIENKQNIIENLKGRLSL